MSSNPGRVELGVHSTSVLSHTLTQRINTVQTNQSISHAHLLDFIHELIVAFLHSLCVSDYIEEKTGKLFVGSTYHGMRGSVHSTDIMFQPIYSQGTLITKSHEMKQLN